MYRISEEKRQAIISAYLAGVPTTDIATRYGVSESYPSQLAGRLQVKRRNLANCKKRGPNINQKTRVVIAEPADDVAELPAPAANNTAEIRRLAGIGRRRTEIAALLRCPYRVVDEALS
ncbi:hypothetical protein LB531_21400 [Mesorhizobium sp. CO1-1-2]|uniref:hypothetical protein n=1 Tax=Mesorhizobium sp. CO1-1-2 TaxID=2876635 RepID=UPI001CCEC435|nr:hypothetical protein [Mesorhizobium sp. CO1-1-2]MBZ9683217.1 hypothetical protein [Mesorhizobium sp. CO1-1-2]